MNEQKALERIRDVVENQSVFLWLEDAPITSLPSLPNHIERMWVSKCKNITKLPELPTKLIDLSCDGTPIKMLPALPSHLHLLNFAETEVEYLPELPQSLRVLHANNSKLAALPTLPECLSILRCWQTNITELPPLPRELRTLECSETRITKLPVLPENLRDLGIFRTPLRELPDQFPESLEYLSAFDMLWADKEIDESPNEYLTRIKKFQQCIADLKSVLEERERRKRTIARCKAVKEDLMAATWRTDRVLDWCDPKAFEYDD